MSDEPPFALTDFLEEANLNPESVSDDQAKRINDALVDLNPALYGIGGGGGGDTQPPTLDGSLDSNEFPGGSIEDFSASIAANEDTAVVGAPGTDLGDGSDEGVAQVFERSNGSFDQVATLTASQPGDRVGENVDVEGTTAVVGAPGTTDPSGGTVGEIYVYTKTGGSWNTTPEIALSNADNIQPKQSTPDLDPSPISNPGVDPFGSVLAIENSTIVAIAQPDGFFGPGLVQFRPRQSGDPDPSGSGPESSWVYIDQFVDLTLPTDIGTDNGLSILTNDDSDDQVARVFPVGVTPAFTRLGPGFDPSNPISGFGAIGDITNPSGTDPIALVGATDQVLVYESSGFRGDVPEFPDTETTSLTPSTGATGAGFGNSSLAVEGTTVVVGAPNEGDGVVYQFQRSGGSWNQSNRITAPSGVTNFGVNLSLDLNTIYVGDGSSVYTFSR